jgi:hypothetical protein
MQLRGVAKLTADVEFRACLAAYSLVRLEFSFGSSLRFNAPDKRFRGFSLLSPTRIVAALYHVNVPRGFNTGVP